MNITKKTLVEFGIVAVQAAVEAVINRSFWKVKKNMTNNKPNINKFLNKG